eukprot:CAMPEP_0174374002 /NCGR_PEP_ID=MMETSP0811_2-20130205/109265_1 /TAXON_ID=73025 ORGANISM="Eutreptiella gymnastica-like, Strain CCMP1594" /NCGR_SAMPLE_ID=MMETSP0811_2 /ASSEMBLY_ACC=CAM_ASM_000667 /LENGTH=30 /DNA_ID= /DNA_START= /DNA_END= /DNA_ORIENTATION=
MKIGGNANQNVDTRKGEGARGTTGGMQSAG